MFPGALQETAPHWLLRACGQRPEFAGIGFQVVKTISRRIELKQELVTGFTHRQHTRSQTIFDVKRVGATSNAFGDCRFVWKSALTYLCPGAVPAERRRNWQPRGLQQSWS